MFNEHVHRKYVNMMLNTRQVQGVLEMEWTIGYIHSKDFIKINSASLDRIKYSVEMLVINLVSSLLSQFGADLI